MFVIKGICTYPVPHSNTTLFIKCKTHLTENSLLIKITIILPFNPQENIAKCSSNYLSHPCCVVVSRGWSHNTARIKFMEEVYWHRLWQETARGRSSKPSLCPACIMVDLHIEYASVNLTVTTGEADTVNQNKSCKKSFTYGTLRCPVMKHGIDIPLCPHLTERHSVI